VSDLLDEREKTHGAFYNVASMAQELKDAMRRGRNWKVLDDTERETLEMIASKIGRILAGNPHEPDHWRDVAGYATLIERALTACNASECGPTPRPVERSPETISLGPVTFVWPMSPEEEEREAEQRRG
jgi:hypothetical protein